MYCKSILFLKSGIKKEETYEARLCAINEFIEHKLLTCNIKAFGKAAKMDENVSEYGT